MKSAILGMLIICSALHISLVAQEESFDFGKNKISLDVLSLAMGRTTFLSSEIGFVYSRRIAESNLEVSARLAYSTLNLILGAVNTNDSLGNATGRRLRQQVGGNGFSVGTLLQHNLPIKEDRWIFYGFDANFTYTHFFSKEPVEGVDHFDLRKLNTSLVVGLRWYIRDLGLEIDAMIGGGVAFRNYNWDDQADSSGSATYDGWNWEKSFDLVIEPSISLSLPVAVRLGYRF